MENRIAKALEILKGFDKLLVHCYPETLFWDREKEGVYISCPLVHSLCGLGYIPAKEIVVKDDKGVSWIPIRTKLIFAIVASAEEERIHEHHYKRAKGMMVFSKALEEMVSWA